MKNILFLLAFFPLLLAAQIRADQLTEITSPASTDAFYTAERGQFQKITLARLATYLGSGNGLQSLTMSGDTLKATKTGGTVLFVVLPYLRTEVDGSTSNELQTITIDSTETTYTVTLSNGGGAVTFQKGGGGGSVTASDVSITALPSVPGATNVQTGLEGIAANTAAVDALVGNLITLSGRPATSTNLGTFTGTTIPDNSTNKTALQALETYAEADADRSATNEIQTLSIAGSNLSISGGNTVPLPSGGGGTKYLDIIGTGQSNYVNRDGTIDTWTYNVDSTIFVQNSSNVFAVASPAATNLSKPDNIPVTAKNNIGWAFARYAKKTMQLDAVRIVPYAVGGISSYQWTPVIEPGTTGNTMLDGLITALNATPNDYQAQIIIWQQGEQDDFDNLNMSKYSARLAAIYDTLVAHDRVSDNAVMLCGYPVNTNAAYDSLRNVLDSISLGQIDFGKRDIRAVVYDEPNVGDNNHFSNEAIENMAKFYVATLYEPKYPKFSWELRGIGGGGAAPDLWTAEPDGIYRNGRIGVNTATVDTEGSIQSFANASSSNLSLRTIGGNLQRLDFLGGSSGAANGGFFWNHLSDGILRNRVRFYDTGFAVEDAANTKFFDVPTTGTGVNTMLRPLQITSALNQNFFNMVASGGGAGEHVSIGWQIASYESAQIRVSLQSAPAGFDMGFFTRNGFAGGTTAERMRIKATGNIGVGTTTPQRLFHVEGELRVADLTTDTPTRLVGADADGDFAAIPLGTANRLSMFSASGIVDAPIESTSGRTRLTQVTGLELNKGTTAEAPAATTAGILRWNTTTERPTISDGTTHARMPLMYSATATLDFPSTSANATSDLTITLTGAAVGEQVIIGAPASAIPEGVTYFPFVSEAGFVTVRLRNSGGGTVDPATGSFTVSIIR